MPYDLCLGLNATIEQVLRRQTSGSVLCTSCGVLVGVNDDRCYNCGRRNPGLWGFAPAVRALGYDMGFVPFVIGTCVVVYVLTLLGSGGNIGMRGVFGFMAPSLVSLLRFGASGEIPVFVLGRWWTVLSAAGPPARQGAVLRRNPARSCGDLHRAGTSETPSP